MPYGRRRGVFKPLFCVLEKTVFLAKRFSRIVSLGDGKLKSEK